MGVTSTDIIPSTKVVHPDQVQNMASYSGLATYIEMMRSAMPEFWGLSSADVLGLPFKVALSLVFGWEQAKSPGISRHGQSLAEVNALDHMCIFKESIDKSRRYERLKLLGSGAFGVVMLCREERTKKLFALKVLDKAAAKEINQVDRVLAERRILSKRNPFIVTMYEAFQSKTHLHLVLEYCCGGDMFSLLDRYTRFNEDMCAFYAASLVLALQHLHECNIIYRDLKPENILIDASGYIRLADFGLIKEGMMPGMRTHSLCGSADYIAPEVIQGSGYDKSVDFWSLGCCLYELLTGYPPFYHKKERSRLRRNINYHEIPYPSYLSPEAKSLLVGLLTVEPEERLGNTNEGFATFFNHEFFHSIDWYALKTKQIYAPFVPEADPELELKCFDPQFTQMKISRGFFDSKSMSGDVNGDQTFAGFDWSYRSL